MSDSAAAPKTDATTAAPAAAAPPAEGASKSQASSGEGSTSTELPVSLYVGELSPSVTEAILFEIFSSVGPVTTIRVCRDAVTHESLRYAYVNFQTHEDAKKAMQELNYAAIKGRPCRIMWSQRDPSARKSGRGNIYVKNLDPSIDNKGLHDTFSMFGDILSCKVVSDNGHSLGFGFVHFSTAEAAQEAINTVDGMIMSGRPLHVTHHLQKFERESRAEAQRAQFTNVYVKNLADSIDQEKLEEIFGKFGKITSAILAVTEDKKSKGFGFVNYETHEDAQKAVDELNDKEVEGKKLYVGRAQNKYERQEELKKKYEAQRMEQLTKYQGVNLYVKNLDNNITSEKLKELFAPFGTITSARVMTSDGKSRGFGFVCYSSPEEANKAISEMNQHIMGGKPLYVALAQRKDVRHNQMRQQLNAHNQMRMQQQQAVGGIAPQFMAPLMYPGQPGFVNGAAPGVRVPFPQPQMMVPPRGVPPMGQWQQQQPIKGQPNAVPAQFTPAASEPLEKVVANLPAEQQKQLIGEELYPRILAQDEIDEQLAGRITGMLLDMENAELFALLKDEAQLKEQVSDALEAYRAFEAQNK